MTRLDIRTEVRALLNDESTTNPRFTDTKLNNRINYGHRVLANTAKVLRSGAEDSLASGVREYALPESTDVLEIERVEIHNNDDPLNISKYTVHPSSQEELDNLDINWKNVEGRPARWYLRDNLIGFDRKPGDAEDGWILRVEYVEKATELDDDTDIPRYPDQYHQLLVFYAVAWCKREDNDFEESELYRRMFEEGAARMKVEQNARKGKIFHLKAQ